MKRADQIVEAMQAQQWNLALKMCREDLPRNRAEARTWLFLARILEAQGQLSGAWLAYDRAWILDPQAVWTQETSARLRGCRDGAVPDWLMELLQVPTSRVQGAILAKNEAANIEKCINALKPAVDRVIVVDTGSEDGTQELAESAGATVINTTWQGDFGLARQAADPILGSDGWVLWVDADEFLEPEDTHVPRTVAGLYSSTVPPTLVRMVQVNYVGQSVQPNYDTTRMYPLGKGFAWMGRIHEQVMAKKGKSVAQRASGVRLKGWTRRIGNVRIR